MMTDLTEKLERLRGLLEKATPGEWGTRFGYNYADDVWVCSDAEKPWNQHMGLKLWVRQVNGKEYAVDSPERKQCEADAALIAEMRNILPALLAQIEADAKRIGEMREARARDLLVMTATREALLSLPEDALGTAESGGAEWPIRDEMVTAINMRINSRTGEA